MYGIFTYIYHKNRSNVGKSTIHRSVMGLEDAIVDLCETKSSRCEGSIFLFQSFGVSEEWKTPKRPRYRSYTVHTPGTPMTSIFEGQPPKTRSFPTKTRVIWVPGSLMLGGSMLCSEAFSTPKT